MTLDVLAAAGSPAYAVGQLTAMIGIPLLGLVLLIVGLNKRSKSKTPPPQQYPYQQYPPQQYSYQQNPAWPPPGYRPPQAAYPTPPPPPPGYPPRKPAGTGFIVAGSILLVFGVLGFLAQVGRVATNVAESRSETPEQMKIGDCLTAAGMATRRMVQKPADCADPKAVFELAATGDGAANCPDGKRDSSDYSVLTNDTTTLCFTLNLVEGRC